MSMLLLLDSLATLQRVAGLSGSNPTTVYDHMKRLALFESTLLEIKKNPHTGNQCAREEHLSEILCQENITFAGYSCLSASQYTCTDWQSGRTI
jgi:hypothetical protein